MGKGLFIAFEGGEGSGKSTIIEKVFKWMISNNKECVLTREPGGIKISEDIRNIILDKNNVKMDSKTEALLYAAARRQHLVEKVIPALEEGKIVLCDRFLHSSLAYQGYARGLGIDEVYNINKFAIGDCMPNLVILFDLDPKVGLERIVANKDREINRLDLEKLDFHYKVREGYNLVASKDSNRVVKIDASRSIEEVFENVLCIIKKLIEDNNN